MLPKSSLLLQDKHIPVNCAKISQIMTCTAGKKKDLEDAQDVCTQNPTHRSEGLKAKYLTAVTCCGGAFGKWN